MTGATKAHLNEMYRAMRYCVGTPNRGLLLKPNAKWDGNPNYEFVVSGRSDSDYAKDPERRRSVSGYSTFLCGAPVTMKSRMQGCVTLDVTSAEFVSATQCAQDRLFTMRVIESMGLKVKKPMILEINNKGAEDLSHNWSVSGRTQHDSIRQSFLRELNEEGIIEVYWIPTEENSSDLFTKNLSGPTFKKHTAVYCGEDEYMKSEEPKRADNSQGEGVGGENCNMADDVTSIESHQSFGESESDTNTKSGKWDSQVREKSIVVKSIIKTTTKPRVNPSHTPTPEKRRKAIKFGKIEWYD